MIRAGGEPNPAGPNPPGMEPDAAGFVLAGGQSSRMGSDKALIQLAGKPLIEHALAILCQGGLAAAIAGARSSLGSFAPVVEDPAPGLGPLSGVCAAMTSTSARYAVFVPVDLPLLPASLLAFLLQRARIEGSAVTLSSVSGFAQTFPAVIDRAILPGLQGGLEAGRAGCFQAFQAAAAAPAQKVTVVPVEFLAQSGHTSHPQGLPVSLWFLNLNTPADLERAERLLATGAIA
jgi:molybdenum cofactor guanylyltransferase